MEFDRGKERVIMLLPNFPEIVTLCGSTRFKNLFVSENLRLTLEGRIVLSIGCDLRTDQEIFGSYTATELEATKHALDVLHLQKIDICDRVHVINRGGYIGQSTSSEILYATRHGKVITYLEPR